MPRDYEVRINRNTMTVIISSGLPKQSSKILRKYSIFFWNYLIIYSLGPNQVNAEKPRALQFKPQTTLV